MLLLRYGECFWRITQEYWVNIYQFQIVFQKYFAIQYNKKQHKLMLWKLLIYYCTLFSLSRNYCETKYKFIQLHKSLWQKHGQTHYRAPPKCHCESLHSLPIQETQLSFLGLLLLKSCKNTTVHHKIFIRIM